MKMQLQMIQETLTDVKHWFGWIITTVTIVGIFHLLDVHLHNPIWHVGVLFGIIVGVDVFKHVVELQ